MAEVLAPELRTDAELLGLRPDLGLHLEIAEGMPVGRSVHRQPVEVLGARVFGDLERILRARAAHDNGEVIRRARGRAELA